MKNYPSMDELQSPDVHMAVANMINIALGFIGMLSVFSVFFFWIVALIQVIIRKDLTEHKLLWILLLIFVAPVGVLAYFFIEKRKGWGIAAAISFAILPFVLVFWSISRAMYL